MRAILTTCVSFLLASTAAASEICFVPSMNGLNHTGDCDPAPQIWPNAWTGFSTDLAPCQDGWCGPLPGPARGVGGDYAWSISASSTNPTQNVAPLPVGVGFLYLWLDCTSADGWAAAEFGIQSGDPNLVIVNLQPVGGVLNAGTATNVQIVVGGCPYAPMLAGILTVFYVGPTAVESESWGGIKAMYR